MGNGNTYLYEIRNSPFIVNEITRLKMEKANLENEIYRLKIQNDELEKNFLNRFIGKKMEEAGKRLKSR
jgi:hypothetical protein